MENNIRNTRVSFHGVVVSDKMDKTIIVLVETYVKHAKYGKRVKYAKKFVAHDPNSLAKIGDAVTIRGCRPLSKTKHFVLVSVDKLSVTGGSSVAEEEVKVLNETIDEASAPEVVEENVEVAPIVAETSVEVFEEASVKEEE